MITFPLFYIGISLRDNIRDYFDNGDFLIYIFVVSTYICMNK